ncbi:MAG: relaxase/mobilization nuclease domain-containing protein [Lachnospiraceae bacterium]|nr:relaxase/mobilization nuclease domain-containing protein [Lachnospiraceae bacterium]
MHNHIIFCAADNIDHHKYNDCKRSYYRIRYLSDELCREHHLSVIVPDGQRGKKYNEWSADRHGDSRKSELRRDINAAIRSADTYDEFLHLLRAKGYVVKGENLDGKSPKYISFLPPGRERFVRGSIKSLGAEYTKERIAERISERVQKRGKALTVGYTGKRLIDTSQEKFQESAGLKRWAEIENLKTAASAYSKVNSIADLEEKIAERSASAKRNSEKLTILERRMKSMAEIIKYAQQYQENRPYQIRYRKAKNPDDYFRKHETELILYDGAKEMLRRAKIDHRTLDINKLRAEFSQMEQKKKELRQAYQTAEKDCRQLERELDKLEQYLNAEPDTVSVQKNTKEPTR